MGGGGGRRGVGLSSLNSSWELSLHVQHNFFIINALLFAHYCYKLQKEKKKEKMSCNLLETMIRINKCI